MGIGLAIWARYHLAEYWSARVTIKEDHQLIRTGPYAHLRHPIYSGLVLATIGSALVIGSGDACWVLFLPDWLTRDICIKAAKRKRSMLTASNSAERLSAKHQKTRGFLIPRFVTLEGEVLDRE